MYPERIPFTIKASSIFVIIRSVFINLTHIAPFPTSIQIDPLSLMNKFTFGGDLFFSGHTGLPFLMAIIFWDNKYLRYLFLFTSILFGTITLMGHLHYSIDVLAAFFITYSIYHISAILFKEDLNINRTIR
jgi:membrane-associated phospholipid phosphatase